MSAWREIKQIEERRQKYLGLPKTEAGYSAYASKGPSGFQPDIIDKRQIVFYTAFGPDFHTPPNTSVRSAASVLRSVGKQYGLWNKYKGWVAHTLQNKYKGWDAHGL